MPSSRVTHCSVWLACLLCFAATAARADDMSSWDGSWSSSDRYAGDSEAEDQAAATSADAAPPADQEPSGGGTGWTGDVEARMGYFYEPSTRVVIPMIRGGLVAPSGWRIGGDVLVDSITSASIAQGAQTDELFTERRWGFGLNLGHSHEIGQDATLNWSVFGRYSTENDYYARSAGWDVQLSVAQHCSNFGFSGGLVNDTVEKSSDANFDKALRGVSSRFSYEQILTPNWTATVALDVAYLDGFLANAYRTIPVPGEGRLAEDHPHERWRIAPSLSTRFHLPISHTSLHLRLRGYTDQWDIHAITTELRIYQELGEHFVSRVRYRRMSQVESYFADNKYRTASGEHLVTADPKMTAFSTQELGLKLEWRLPFLDAISLGEAWFDLSFDYRWNENRYGNAVLAQAGMRVPF